MISSQWQGKNVWIIGASFGIGRVLAQDLAKEGAHIILSARTQEALKDVSDTLSGQNHNVVSCDVTSHASMKKAFQQISTQYSSLDAVIYAAGTYQTGSLANFSLTEAQQTLDTNYRGLLYMLDVLLPFLKKQRQGMIAIIGSVAGYNGFPESTTYPATKAAVNSLAESLKIDLEPYNIDVRLICPGFVQTRLTDKNDFRMPFLISADQASKAIMKGFSKKSFEIHFPTIFTYYLKLFKFLPYTIFFFFMRRLQFDPGANTSKTKKP